MSISRRKLLIGGAAASVAAAGGAFALFEGLNLGHRSENVSEAWTAQAITAEDIAAAGPLRVFFGHQSVGMNVIGGLPAVFAANGLSTPDILELGSAGELSLPDGERGVFSHAYIGENGDPLGKIRDFDAKIRAGLGHQIDVALMKLCYVDIASNTDPEAVFQAYRTTLATLERDFPRVTFVHVTNPLTTEPDGRKAALKKLLGRPDTTRADNVSRERLNRLIRQAYAPDRLFDLAAVESTMPDGNQVSGTLDGQDYHALYGGFAADEGHLNEAGSQVAAAHLLGVIARTTKS